MLRLTHDLHRVLLCITLGAVSRYEVYQPTEVGTLQVTLRVVIDQITVQVNNALFLILCCAAVGVTIFICGAPEGC